MSKLSPYRKPTNPQKKQPSPPPTHYDNKPYNDKYKNTKQFSHDNKSKYNHQQTIYQYRPTQKKKYDLISDYDLDSLIEKNRSLAAQNAQLYQMLEERGRIIMALQKKLQEQILRQVNTLQAIERQKNIFIGQTQKKFKEYQRKIQQLINEIYQLNEQKYQQNIIKAREIDFIKDSFTKDQIIKLHSFANDQMTAREETQFQRNKVKTLLDLKNHQISQLNMEFKNTVDKLKNQIITLNNDILHINHLRKIELSEQKIAYQNIIDNIARENNKEKEIINIEHNLALKKLEQLLAYKAIQTSNINQLKKIGEIQQNVRETQLLEKKSKLQLQIQQLEQFYRKQSFDYAKQQKQLNKTALQALQSGNEALIGNLKAEIQKMVNLNSTKTQQINNLFNQISVQRLQNSQSIKNYENIIQQLKQKMRQMQKDHMIEQEQLKIKWAELSQANLATLKQYYEHQIDVLQHQFIQKSKLSDSNRQKLHQQLQQKNQMRKRFDLQILKLNTRISQLQLQVNELIMLKKQETTHLNTNMTLTSSKLIRQTKDKQKLNFSNQQERKKLQELILAKDKEIQQLNLKIRFMRQNYSKQIAQKNAEIEIIKKHKEDVETQLRKQKLFYDNEIKKKDIIIKDCKQHFETQTQRLKLSTRQQYDSLSNDLSSKINQLEVELNRYKTLQKTLRNENESLKKELTTEIQETKNDLTNQKEKLSQSKKISEDRLNKQNKEQQQRLNKQINELRKQLAYKQQDLRNKTEDYHMLQQKMTMVIQSQDKLRNIEHRIINLGQQNNLVKNFAEIIKSKSNG